MAVGMLMKVLCVAVAFLVVVTPYAEAALTLEQVLEKIMPCFNYFRNGGSVPSDCCNGVRGVNNDSKSSADKQVACNCIKTLASYPDVKKANILGLPDKCGVKFPYKFSNMTDCTKVQ